MRNILGRFTLVSLVILFWPAGLARADVVIKVRALNPLNSAETALINYPLPKQVTADNILKKKITYSKDHSEDEEPPKTDFQVTFDEDRGLFIIDDEIFLQPREVVTLELHVRDVWVIERARIEELQQEVNKLLEAWEARMADIFDSLSEEQRAKDEETKEFALMMKGEILKSLESIMGRQDQNSILQVGVEKHIEAYEDNLEDLRQVQQDVVLLANLIQLDNVPEEEMEVGEQEAAPSGEDESEAGEETEVLIEEEGPETVAEDAIPEDHSPEETAPAGDEEVGTTDDAGALDLE